MPPIKPMSTISQKWTARARTSTQDYANGIANTPKDWATNTAAASSSYNEGVQAAIAGNRFQDGVTRAGTAKWKQNALAKGPARWADGVQKSADNYTRGFEPYRRVIESTQLSQRGPKGSPQNYQRSQEMGTALHTAKIQGA